MIKKRIYQSSFVILSMFLLLFSACTSSQNENESNDSYTCSMHPQIHENKPGNCPICGMELVKEIKNEPTESKSETGSSSYVKRNQVLSSLATVKMKYSTEKLSFKALGRVEYDTRFIQTISAQIEGRIEKIYVKYAFQYLEKGQKIMDIYSPELLTAQQNLLFLLKNDADNISLIKTAENRLLLMGMSENQLNQIKKDKKPLMSISVYSNYSGYVYEKGVLESSTTLSLKEGNYVKKGQALFQINDKNKAWIVFDAFPEDIAFVKVGEAVKIIPDASPENDFEAKIGFVEPFYVNNSKTLKARIYFDNKLQKLSIGSQIKVLIENEIPKSYWLPKSAVISLGDKQIVFVKQRNTFSPKTIQTGVKTEELIQIVDGLENDNEICVNASFLIDNESLIKPN